MKRKKILDRMTHGGNQYEFAKLPHDIYMINLDGTPASWDKSNRPNRSNLHMISEKEALRNHFDIVMIRNHSLNPERYKPFIRNGAKAIGVIHTTTAFQFPKYVQHIVFNSKRVMEKHKDLYKGKTLHYIPHGYDPDEFKQVDGIVRNDRVLTVINAFKPRSKFLGLDLWTDVRNAIQKIDLLGDSNDDLAQQLDVSSGKFLHGVGMQDLILYYSKYALYFNPTNSSAMPRSRCEAIFCGMPLVSTSNYDIDMYFKNGKDGIITNDKDELVNGIRKILSDKNVANDFGNRSREIAIENFHIKHNLKKWQHVIDSL